MADVIKIARLLLRFSDVQEGIVRIGNVDVRTVPITNLREHAGLVTQNVQLFHATVRDNVTFFDPTVPDEQILSIFETLGLWKWYEVLPNGLNTMLTSSGKNLSAGEGQLLAFVRIFLKDPGLIILDEASSRLDPTTERLIEQALDKLLQNRTGIVIAHHLRTIERADEIMILEKGQIVEYGERAKLSKDSNSRLHELLQTGVEKGLA